MSKLRKGAQHYCDHEWRWLGWLAVLSLGIVVVGMRGVLVEKEQEPASTYVVVMPQKPLPKSIK